MVALVVAGVLTLVEPSPVGLFWLPAHKHAIFRRSNLVPARDEIARFREATGRYPRSLR